MVAVVTGSGTGLERTSAMVLGSAGRLGSSVLGRSGDNVFVNAANGNLVIQNTDEMLIGRGLAGNDIFTRSYNSQGTFTADNWQESTQRQVSGLTGTVNTSGSTVQHIAWDGSVVTYTYDAGRGAYVGNENDGALETLTFSGTTWTWREGATGVTETYDSVNGGRITGRADPDGNTLTYTYTGTLLTKVTTQSGEFTALSYTGNNLTQITTSLSGGQTLTRVRYGYDPSNRLTTVTVDLTPGDNSIVDGKTYVTTYGYDGTSTRVSSITQSDGSSLQIGYVQVDTAYKVQTLTQAVGGGLAPRVTTFTYDSATQTTVTDPLGLSTVLTYDGSGRLTQVTAPPASAGATAQVTQFTYNSLGEVLTVVAPNGDTTTYTYDSNGNQLTAVAATGDTVTRTYSSTDLLLTETRSPASGVSMTTNYVYDSERHLRFVISPQGDVTEFRYDAAGQQTAAIRYVTATYTVSGTPTESGLDSWVSGLGDLSGTQRTDTTYDFRGNVQSVTTYSKVLASGAGDTSASFNRILCVYDQAGKLLSRQQDGSSASETYAYDGLFRQTLATDLTGASTQIAFNDALNKTVITLANGTTETSTYNLNGELLSTSASASGMTTATVTNKYDADGRLRMTTDATGVKTYFLYDNVGRKVADIAANGALVEYRYDANDRLAVTIQYKIKLTGAQLSSLVDANGNPTAVALDAVRPGANTDRWNWTIYDGAGRVIETIDSTGGVTVYTYDKASRVTSVKTYAKFLSSTVVTGLKTTPPTALVLPTVDATHDDVTRDFYDNDGRLIAQLDTAGHLTQSVYDAAGELVQAIRSANAVASNLRATGTLAQLIASAATSSQDQKTSYAYDAAGRLRFQVEANGRVCEYVYDAAGNLIRKVEYANTIATTANYSLAYVQSHLSASGADRVTRSVYDSANRLAFSIDAAGGVVGYSYDTLGHVVKQVAYATAYTASGDPSLSAMQSFATGAASPADRVSRVLYDAYGRAVFAVDAESYVTQSNYDLADRVTKEIRYASTYTVGDATTAAMLSAVVGGTPPPTAAVTSFTYDTAGQLTDVTDPMGTVTRYVRDALGQVTSVTEAYGTADAAVTTYAYDTQGRVKSTTSASGTPEAATSTFTFDAQNHVLTSVDARGFTTTNNYDSIGQLISVTSPIDASNTAVTTYQYDSFGNRVAVTDPRGNTGYFYYDSLNRLVLEVDPEGYVTETAYSIGDQAISVTRYANRVTNAPSATTMPTWTPAPGDDATTLIGRNKLDRVTSTTNALGDSETYVLNAFGDRTTVFNRKGVATTYAYDRRGLMLSETLPVPAYRADGTVEAANITNTYSYDARGNKTGMVEASGLTEQRDTTYVYDKNNRLIQKLSEGGINETTKYDRRGNIIETVDSTLGRTLYYYDDLNRKIASISPVGTLTAWTYDKNSNVTGVTIYGTTVALPATAGGTPPAAPGGEQRQTIYAYDRANRLISTTNPALLNGSYVGGAYQSATADVIVQTFYDKAGNVIRQIDALGNSVFSYYDKLGHKIAQVDQNKYLTFYTLDSDGNVTKEERFATALTGIVDVVSSPTALRMAVAKTSDDRITTFTYDRNGQRLTETRQGVNGIGGSADSTITYVYNKFGQVKQKVEATGESTSYTYDEIGRLVSTSSAGFFDYTGAYVSPQTQTWYDGLNNVVRTRVGRAGTPAADDRITTFVYEDGRLASSTDAAGATTTYTYDAAGRQTGQGFLRITNLGMVANSVVTHYDAAGRVDFQQTQEAGGSGDYTTLTYNAYGEVVLKGLNGVDQEYFVYDTAGRLTKTNTNGGVVQLFGYDAAGRQTLMVSAAGADLSGQTTAAGAATAFAANPGVAITYQVYDARGQATQTVELDRQLSATVTRTLTHDRAYNAFGEVRQQTEYRDSQALVTDFAYNTMGRLTLQQSPTISVTAENGAVSSIRPTFVYGYDASGRLVRTTDANGAVTTRQLLAGTGYGDTEAVVVAEHHADGGVFTVKADVFGNARTITNEVGATETRTYDAMGRLIAVAHPMRSDGVQLIDYYSYDQFGQRLAHWNSLYGAGVRETTDYDSMGRVIRQVDFGGHITTTDYTWYSNVYTQGMGGFGGWSKVTVTADGTKDSFEVIDAFGRTTQRQDLGDHAFVMQYDTAGRLVHQTNDAATPFLAGQNLVYSYFNTGRVASLQDDAAAHTTTYGYDEAGNQILEEVVGLATYYDPLGNCSTGPGTVLQNTQVTYDALNRMLTLTDSGFAGGPGVSISYEYDANGNIRHIASIYRDLTTNAQTSEDNWYLYDSMNRFVTTKGTLVGARGSGTIQRGDRGVDITYNAAGQRVSATTTAVEDIYLEARWVPPTNTTVTVPGHMVAGQHVAGYWAWECVPEHVVPGSTTPGYWEAVPEVNLHDGYTIEGYYAWECAPEQIIPGGVTPGYWEHVPEVNLHDGYTIEGYYTYECAPEQVIPGEITPGYWETVTVPGYWEPGEVTPGYWEEVTEPGHWEPGPYTPGYWVTDSSGNNLYYVDPVQGDPVWVPGATTYVWHEPTTGSPVWVPPYSYNVWHDPVQQPDTVIPEHWVSVWHPPVVVPDTIIPAHNVWHDPVTAPDTVVPAAWVNVWHPPHDEPEHWVPETTTTVQTPGYWQPAGYVHTSGAHTEYYAYTADGFLSMVSISDGKYDPVTQTLSAPSFETAVLRSLDVRDAMGRVVNHTEYAARTQVTGGGAPPPGPTGGTTVTPGHWEVTGCHIEVISEAYYDPAVHIDGFYDLDCVWHAPVDIPGAYHEAVTQQVEDRVWVPETTVYTPGTATGGTVIPAHWEVVGSHVEIITPAYDDPAQHIDGFFDLNCVWHDPVDIPGQHHEAVTQVVEDRVWVPDSVAYTPGTPTVVTISYEVFQRTATYDRNSNQLTDDSATLNADGTVAVSHTDFQYGALQGDQGTGAYQGGVVTHSTMRFGSLASGTTVVSGMSQLLNNRNAVAPNISETTTSYVWWDSAQQQQITYRPNISSSTVNTTTFTYNADGRLTMAQIFDGRPRTITYVDNAIGQIIGRFDSTGPKEYYYNFAGMQRGDVGNDGRGPSAADYATAIAARQAAAQTGAFRNGQATSFADFDQSYVPINPSTTASTGADYTVREGDTLQSIAQAIWGDASLWYLIADANGLTGASTLPAGMTLVLPNKVVNLHNSSSTFRVYDPNKAIGDVEPNVPQPTPQPQPATAKKKKHGCGIAQIIVAAVAVAVALVVAPYAAGAIAGSLGGSSAAAAGALAIGGTGFAGLAGTGLATFAGVVAGAAVGAAAGSIVSQGVGLAIGAQDKFSWKAVAQAAIGGGVGASFGAIIPGSTFLAGAARGVAGSVVSQGIGIATGLQSKFDWTGVAVSGVGGGVGAKVGDWASGYFTDFGTSLISGAAASIAGAATRSALDGTSFGDNILADLPSTIGNTIGNAIARGATNGGFGSVASDIAHDLGVLGQGIKTAGNAIVDGAERAIEGVAGAFEGLFARRGASQTADALAAPSGLWGGEIIEIGGGNSGRPGPRHNGGPSMVTPGGRLPGLEPDLNYPRVPQGWDSGGVDTGGLYYPNVRNPVLADGTPWPRATPEAVESILAQIPGSGPRMTVYVPLDNIGPLLIGETATLTFNLPSGYSSVTLIGTPQATRSGGAPTGHALHSITEALRMVRSNQFETVYFNRSWSTINSNMFQSLIRPDVVGVARPSLNLPYRYYPFESFSPGQNLRQRQPSMPNVPYIAPLRGQPYRPPGI